ncbi:MAG: NAD(P)(+) transhydrogenase (Re/Si-specific) subunit alpha [Gammaproteobacteria bacterium]|nr:NAD(P)(+) transhydrogenase (Re/Si-specific) subunit alpha [Gammaproteobacteria bacterium]
MPLTIAVPKETAREEMRVALVPEVVDRLINQHRVQVNIEDGCGRGAGFYNPDYGDVIVGKDYGETVADADIVLKVNPPSVEEAEQLPLGSVLITQIPAFQYADVIRVLLQRRITTIAMHLLPRITRAQSMDVLSSQATVAGYKAALLAAEYSPRLFPMLTTAAGTIRPSRVIVLGAGVAGLQAIATCRRLGAQVEAYDIRQAAREQIESLGARMIDTGVLAENPNGTARGLNKEEKQKQHDVLAERMSHAHAVICAAAIPGRRAPRIVTEDMVQGMMPDTVLVDMAAETGGNCELTKPGEIYIYGDTILIGPINLPSRGAVHASEMYARNLFNMLKLVINDGALRLNWADEIVARCLLTHQGNVHHAATAKLMDLPCAPPIVDELEQSEESSDQAAGWIPESEEEHETTDRSDDSFEDVASATAAVTQEQAIPEVPASENEDSATDEPIDRDDFTVIDGIGPALQSKLYEFGYFQYNDLASLDTDAIETLDGQLELDGHIERDDWVGQAARLLRSKS